ncbi:MAG: hypothetical protein A2534_04705 [Candidatus Magasanikbacteria bacterium RIFOXYD2_FULL_39_9]|uniref:Rod shape-determining protein MreD n=1 Tax=Candidatus Magasanikbacteria bacterium RIFOXYD1_FULL_40_23 TaxID=1798705 RepID=A0A1F6PAU4_9BACT|nr:MAG: hypothetical protein A2534_04705 [Candidatus Magasanikbacteria bacterium RIFOXYD2_FULL_39_9]OGH93301.1 MAG: hypothetical protein A2563_01700 [Candidatus Magasanikbacteria bacterium RIFOXYD1_FULL_40_23]
MFFLSIFLILAAHIFVVNFLPFPFSHINIIFSLSLLILTISPSSRVLWLALITSYVSELFSSIPFGIGTAALFISLLIINWFQLNILTNRSVYMIFLSAILGISLYRALFVLLLTVNNYFYSLAPLPYREILADAGWEVLLSSLLLFFLYLLDVKFLRHFRSSSSKSIRMYG